MKNNIIDRIKRRVLDADSVEELFTYACHPSGRSIVFSSNDLELKFYFKFNIDIDSSEEKPIRYIINLRDYKLTACSLYIYEKSSNENNSLLNREDDDLIRSDLNFGQWVLDHYKSILDAKNKESAAIRDFNAKIKAKKRDLI
jgi:hypothetical protein